ncbi:MAG TPA: hypothetical protein VGH33_24150 [Isosphaeraceae bacterium]
MASTKKTDEQAGSENSDPLSGEKGAHPVGTGLGAAAGGAAAGAAGGAIAGPAGAAVGAVIGAVAGGLAGKGVAENIDPTVEGTYWRDQYKSRPYYEKGHEFDYYEPAYRYGWESRGRYADRSFDEVESDLGRGWEKVRGHSKMTWDKARHATRDAWDRIGTSMSRKS